MEKKVLCASSLSGETLIWTENVTAEISENVLFAAMVTNPETGARILSFCPVKTLAKDQNLYRKSMLALLSNGFSSAYEPEPEIAARYRSLVEDEKRFSAFLANFCECRDHDPERLRMAMEEQRQAQILAEEERTRDLAPPHKLVLDGKTSVKSTSGNVITAAFREGQLFEEDD